MKIGIFGLPNSGKSQFRRWLVKKLRDAGFKAEHWDADNFNKPRCREDEDMKKPTDDPETIWLIEDVRGTTPYKPFVVLGEKHGAWQSISYYDYFFYLLPEYKNYQMFWVSRALQWQKTGVGNWQRETGWERLDSDDSILRKVYYFLSNYDSWTDRDNEWLNAIRHHDTFQRFIIPIWTENNTIEWNFDFEQFAAVLRKSLDVK